MADKASQNVRQVLTDLYARQSAGLLVGGDKAMIPFARYRLHCRTIDALVLPRYAGSTWRGAFGHALKRTVCVTHLPDCRKCLLWRHCPYSYLFETPPPQGTVMLRKYPAAPHPFLIHPEATNGTRCGAGESLSLDLTLIGRANAHLAYILHALHETGMRGIGRGRGRFALEAVDQFHFSQGWREIYSPEGTLAAHPPQAVEIPPAPVSSCTLRFITPLRVTHQEQLMGEDGFSFRGFLAALLRRLSLLSYFHVGEELVADFRDLLAQAEDVHPVATELSWYDWERYSNRQKTAMRMGGLVGQATFSGKDLAPFWPWLWVGQAVHVGKGTVMGLGGYRIEAEGLPNAFSLGID